MINNNQTENILNWKDEAEGIIHDVQHHVNYIGISKQLKSSATEIYLNLKTLENTDFCIRASGNGFQIVAEEFDKITYKKSTEDEAIDIFETPYALLNKISPSYTKSFANQLMNKLEDLQNEIEQ